MEHWQQTFERTDPWPSIPFEDSTPKNIDARVGLVCLAAALLIIVLGL